MHEKADLPLIKSHFLFVVDQVEILAVEEVALAVDVVGILADDYLLAVGGESLAVLCAGHFFGGFQGGGF